jgi:predicted porin
MSSPRRNHFYHLIVEGALRDDPGRSRIHIQPLLYGTFMNRIIAPLVVFAAGAVGASGAAFAQQQSGGGSGITFYGVADGFLQSARGATTLNRLQSGGLSGSRFGLRGSEDLGDGLRGIFTLEAGINLDDGTFGQGGIAFGRQAFAGLQGGFGQLTLGRQYSSAYFASNASARLATTPMAQAQA